MAAREWKGGLLALALAGSAAVQAGPIGIGTPATKEAVAGWNIDVAPDGVSLPPGGSTVAAGQALYAAQCAGCHGAKLEGGFAPALTGGLGSLATPKPVKTIQSYWPYATTVFDYVRRAMPFQAPQTLSNDEVYAVTGYLLAFNGLMPNDAQVDAKALMAVKMPNRDGFYVDDRPDAKNARCMQHCLAKR
jgi:S-disulfanyl-L-cysteine oxidoreductase SoxD